MHNNGKRGKGGVGSAAPERDYDSTIALSQYAVMVG
jgi:hypothetical protein